MDSEIIWTYFEDIKIKKKKKDKDESEFVELYPPFLLRIGIYQKDYKNVIFECIRSTKSPDEIYKGKYELDEIQKVLDFNMKYQAFIKNKYSYYIEYTPDEIKLNYILNDDNKKEDKKKERIEASIPLKKQEEYIDIKFRMEYLKKSINRVKELNKNLEKELKTIENSNEKIEKINEDISKRLKDLEKLQKESLESSLNKIND